MANNKKRNSNKRKGKGKGGKKPAPKAPVPSAATIVADALPMKVVSSDGVEFEISVKAAKRCLNIMKYVKEVNAEEYPSTAPPMHFPDVHSDYMKDVVEWCEYHRDYPLFEEKDKHRKRTVPVPRATWEHEFVSQFGPNEINGLICAAHAFDARCLLDRSAQALASMIKGKTSEQLRQTFGIKNDFTPEEEARMLEENKEMEKLEKRLHTRKAISFFKKLKEASGGGCDCDCNRNNRKDRSDSDSEEEDHDEAGPGPSTSKNRIEQRRQQICEHLCNGHH